MLREQRYEIYYEASLKELKENRDNKNIEKNLKRYDYDPKTKTIKGNNGKRVPFKIQEGEGVNGTAKMRNRKIKGISVTKDALKNKKDADNTIQHELGHINQFKNYRKAERLGNTSKVENRIEQKLEEKIKEEKKKENPNVDALRKYEKQLKAHEKKIRDRYGEENVKFLQDIIKLEDECERLIETSKKERLNKHDADTQEVYADLYARKHTGRSCMKKSESLSNYVKQKTQKKGTETLVGLNKKSDELVLKNKLKSGKINKEQYKQSIDELNKKYKKDIKDYVEHIKPLSTHERNRINKRGKDLTKLIHESKEEFFDVIDELSVMYESGEIDSAEYEIIRDLAFQAYL